MYTLGGNVTSEPTGGLFNFNYNPKNSRIASQDEEEYKRVTIWSDGTILSVKKNEGDLDQVGGGQRFELIVGHKVNVSAQ
jgi:hypothetical protein